MHQALYQLIDKWPLLLLVDQQPYWRELATSALRDEHFRVCTLENYNDFSISGCLKGEKPDLVVLGCGSLRAAERQFISRILAKKWPILVLCSSLSRGEIRELFLQGVDDVLDKSFNPVHIVSAVKRALKGMVALCSP